MLVFHFPFFAVLRTIFFVVIVSPSYNTFSYLCVARNELTTVLFLTCLSLVFALQLAPGACSAGQWPVAAAAWDLQFGLPGGYSAHQRPTPSSPSAPSPPSPPSPPTPSTRSARTTTPFLAAGAESSLRHHHLCHHCQPHHRREPQHHHHGPPPTNLVHRDGLTRPPAEILHSEHPLHHPQQQRSIPVLLLPNPLSTAVSTAVPTSLSPRRPTNSNRLPPRPEQHRAASSKRAPNNPSIRISLRPPRQNSLQRLSRPRSRSISKLQLSAPTTQTSLPLLFARPTTRINSRLLRAVAPLPRASGTRPTRHHGPPRNNANVASEDPRHRSRPRSRSSTLRFVPWPKQMTRTIPPQEATHY